jgi:hypothetical protein
MFGLAVVFSRCLSRWGLQGNYCTRPRVLFMKQRTTIRLITCQVRGLACAVNLLTERGTPNSGHSASLIFRLTEY